MDFLQPDDALYLDDDGVSARRRQRRGSVQQASLSPRPNRNMSENETSLRRAASLRVPKGARSGARSPDVKKRGSLQSGAVALANLNQGQCAMIRKTWRHIHNKSLVSAFKRVFVDVGTKIPGVHNAFAESAVLNAIDPGDESRHIENKEEENEEEAESQNGIIIVLDFEAFARAGSLEHASSVRTLDDHCTFMNDFLDEIIENLEEPSRLRALFQDYGERHGCLCERYKLNGEMWETFGEKLLHCITTRDGVREHKEARKIWCTLVSCIIDEMRCGFERGARRFRRGSSHSGGAAEESSRHSSHSSTSNSRRGSIAQSDNFVYQHHGQLAPPMLNGQYSTSASAMTMPQYFSAEQFAQMNTQQQQQVLYAQQAQMAQLQSNFQQINMNYPNPTSMDNYPSGFYQQQQQPHHQ